MVTEKTNGQPTVAELMVKIGEASVKGDITEVIRLSNLMKKHQSEIEDAEIARQEKEAEELSGSRIKLGDDILKALVGTKKEPGPLKSWGLVDVKATGFTFTLPYKDAQGVITNEARGGSVTLSVPAIKTKSKRTGGGGGSTGSLKASTGQSRSQLVETYGTAEDKAKIKEAMDKAVERKDSARYQAEKPVIVRILADHPELVKK